MASSWVRRVKSLVSFLHCLGRFTLHIINKHSITEAGRAEDESVNDDESIGGI